MLQPCEPLPFFTIPWFCSPATALLAFLWFFTISKSDTLICTQWNCKCLLILINGIDAHKSALQTSPVCKRTLCLPTFKLNHCNEHWCILPPYSPMWHTNNVSLFQLTPQTAHSLPLWPLSCYFNWKNGYLNMIKFWKLFYPLMH